MAATFFDATEDYDKALLHSSVRTHAEADRVAEEVEQEIIERYTLSGTPTLNERVSGVSAYLYYYAENNLWYTVALLGYNPTLSSAAGYSATRSAWTGFCKAFRRVIADVTSHRLRHYHAEADVVAESAGRESWTYGQSRDLRWPRGWDRPLSKYDKKPPVWSL